MAGKERLRPVIIIGSLRKGRFGPLAGKTRDVHPQRCHRDVQGFSLHAPADIDVGLAPRGRALAGPEPGTVFL
ncbi:hypothetical protein ADK65_01650 [Streptomyces sp. NRRL B-1140]|uniref:hypothetical protein n=1 Tax=Streptomyces sp. NRRL B-1140 TaxID=1415549 RepID=UPI0006AF63D6|nr:hypothetical protein [Streptomyces sp. NRRL B-1140]KOX06468.1 hypothetical protein ADK65_01650 [Streptomyces sp. NRRL B-1140]